jgi:uncharacterized membrane protein/nitrite reductase/ring-hydroxylating ferredoxin subunit
MKTVLQGRGIKHPLHPLLIHFPIALFVFSLVLDIASWVGPLDHSSQGAFYTMALGVATALLAAIPGFIDYADIRDDNPAKRIGSIHMVLNLAVVAAYAVNLGLRYPNLGAAQTAPAPFWLSVGGIVLLAISGYLGGEMVYNHGVGVGRHRRETETPQRTRVVPKAGDWVPVAGADALPEGGTLRVDVQGQVLCVAKSEGRFYAFQEFCTHRYGPLSEGAICRNEVSCPWHGSVFDMGTGRVVKGPAKVDLKTYRAELRDGQICVSLQRNDAAGGEQHEIAA